MPVYDWDGDGLDEVVNFNPDMFYVVDGDGGNLVKKTISGNVRRRQLPSMPSRSWPTSRITAPTQFSSPAAMPSLG